jgi:hypothetical protein
MATEHRQKLSDQIPIDFNFGPAFVHGDNIASVIVTVPTNITEVVAHRIVSAQTIQCRFNTSAATVGTTYTVRVQATTTAGDVKILDLDIIAEAD